MQKEIYQKRSERRNAKKKMNKKIIPLVIIFTLFISVFAYSKNSSADNNKVSNPSVELNVEKISRDKVKIALSNFTPVIKSLQINLEINGNVKFVEDSINWLVSSDSNDVKTHVKMGSDKKSMEIFVVSNDALNKVGGTLDICEIEVSKASSGSSAYSIDASVNSDGISYSYVVNDTNKQVSGIDMDNLSEDKLTINSLPVISLKNSSSIVDGKIVISKGDTFDAKSYIEVTDEEDGVISTDNVTVEGKVNTKIVGSYAITYSVADTEGDTSSLETTVIVEDIAEDNATNPVITVNNSDSDKLTISAGDNVDLNEYITAVDYLGRPITVEITGDYDLTTPGTYIITAIATDRFGNVSEKEITLVVEKSDDSSNSDGVSKAYKFKATITNSEGKVVAGEKFNLYKVEVKKRWFRADSENLVYISTLESNEEGEIYAELEEAGKYVLKQVNSATGNEVTDSEVTIELTEDNKGNVITIPDIVINDATSGDSGSNDDNGNNGDTGTDDSGSGDIGTGDSDSGNSGDNGNTDSSNKSEVPVNPEDPDSSDNSNNGVTNDDKITEENKNDLPKTGQGVFYGVTIAVAVIVIGSGVYLVTKKKK
ncbi:immunoglobulin-like domain-containing protein [uncultured Clostridium sp.]|uniref:immunoglobulin-like domain-containing protein n=1 Tax=uncultured Clostridium sp. TaxID=59620 RepID=UPI0025E0B2D7|nr:immunoglobulin-like domain-containing protein [uncultured Clostridium sp.]